MAKNTKNTLIKFLPLIVLLAGLIIMTVCFFVNGGKLSDANATIADQNAKIEALTADLAAMQAELDAKLAEVNDLTAKLDDNSELETAKADLAAANAEIEALNAAIADADAKLNGILVLLGVEIPGEEVVEEAPEAEAPAAE